jgi:hypothetical protein
MEPLDEKELNELLQKWQAPAAPAGLKRKVLPQQRTSWSSWLLKGSIRVPVPVALAAALFVALWIYTARPSAPARFADPSTVSLADFKPVQQLEPVVVSGGQK